MALSDRQTNKNIVIQNGGKILALIFLLFTSCSPKAGNKVLTIFFDGVPTVDTIDEVADETLNISKTLEDSIKNIIAENPFLSYHEPYRRKECLSCHDKNAVGNLLQTEPDLCFSCHEDFNTKYKYLHGPVSAGFCSTCHQAHVSKSRKLLLSPGNQLCFPCHTSYEIEQPDTHIKIGDSLCTDCHNPHGENKKPHTKIKLTS